MWLGYRLSVGASRLTQIAHAKSEVSPGQNKRSAVLLSALSRWLEASHRLAQSLESAGSSARITTWQAPLWPKAGFTTNFKKWQKQRGKPLEPLNRPEAINPLPAGIVAWGGGP